MLKTLIIATVLLPTLALAQRFQQPPQPRQPGQAASTKADVKDLWAQKTTKETYRRE